MAAYPELRLCISGEWRRRPGQPVFNPFDDSVLGELPHATREDMDDALARAAEGHRAWRRTAPAKRAQIMQQAARLLRERADAIAHAITLEQGKPVGQARVEVLRACDIIEWDAEEGRRAYGRVIPAEPGLRHIVVREPIGIVAGFAPWNFPISSPTRKVAGALAAGCAIILKASEETPAGAFHLVQAFLDAGVPDGALSLLFGVPGEISDHLIPQPGVRLVTFTGSVPVGKRLAAMAGAHMKPAIMELGGHAPVIVCGDADPDSAAATSAIGKSRNAGQVCVSPTRFFVDDAIHDRFASAFGERAAAVRIGNGLEPDTQMGPLANHRRVEAMERLVADALGRGARLLAGGSRAGNRGCLFPLTVLADVPDDALAMREEPFGPLALISRTRDIGEAIGKANSLPFGLAAYAFTQSAPHVERLSDEMECGNLSINHLTASIAETPFGGVKDSGYGREGGSEGLACYTVTKNVSHLVTPPG
ncbi:NAD-dependent succinate-semialdehyde dehydrogenase [Roseicella frigidaeris]|uniref:NAD-dependent succinate-semialdehyde dehydrogenase n=1 Tax=Roseicella frigidaeris TaxID=2230885 RepID=A0A327MAM8_9PROT|nr:NAD-dependent succinate-semialdehyde dehydrogenase [Roseicella frigidaeris]RAI59506.1 NAD-dependent succinate-semialdehyde dehydrogenase [Roseicella frigidaeris]